MTKNILEKIVLTNIPNYDATDENCENLYYKAKANGIGRILVGPSSMKSIEGFAGRGVDVAVSIAYPSGAVCPQLKAQEIKDCEADSSIADMYVVAAAQGYFMSGHEDNLIEEMNLCVKAVDKPVYFLIEAGEMPDGELESFCRNAKAAKVAGMILSTSFAPYDMLKRPDGNDIKRIKKAAGDNLEIIAAGDICSEEDIQSALSAGADSVMVNIKQGIIGV